MATYSSIKLAVAGAAGIGGVTTFATAGALPTSGNSVGDQAFVSGNNRLYIWNGSGWYNIALINTNPSSISFTQSGGGSFDGTSFSLDDANLTNTVVTIVATDPEGLEITYTAAADSNFNALATFSQDSSVFTITPKSEDSATTTSGTITFTASDGVNVSNSIRTFSLTFTSNNPTFLTFGSDGNIRTLQETETGMTAATRGTRVTGGTAGTTSSTYGSLYNDPYDFSSVDSADYAWLVPWDYSNYGGANAPFANSTAYGDRYWQRIHGGNSNASGDPLQNVSLCRGYDISANGRYAAVSDEDGNAKKVIIVDRRGINDVRHWLPSNSNCSLVVEIPKSQLTTEEHRPSSFANPRWSADGSKLWGGDNMIVEIAFDTGYEYGVGTTSGNNPSRYTVTRYHVNEQNTGSISTSFTTLGSGNNATAGVTGTPPQNATGYGCWCFSHDGTKLFFVRGQTGGTAGVYEYTLGTAYDLSTASYVTKIDRFWDVGRNAQSGSISYRYQAACACEWSADGHVFKVFYADTPRHVNWVTDVPFSVADFKLEGRQNTLTSCRAAKIDPFDEKTVYITTGAGTSSSFQFEPSPIYNDTYLAGWNRPTAWSKASGFSATINDRVEEFCFNSDGTRIYWCNTTYDTVYQADLSTAYDPTTASNVDGPTDSSSTNLWSIKVAGPNDEYLYWISDASNGYIYRITMATPGDITTINNGVFDFTTYDTNQSYTCTKDPYSIQFNADGTKMFYSMKGDAAYNIYEVPLSTAYDLSSAGTEVTYDFKDFTGANSNSLYQYDRSSGSGDWYHTLQWTITNTKFEFYNNGLNAHIMPQSDDFTCYWLELSTAYDLSTASIINPETINNWYACQNRYRSRSFTVHPAGSKMILGGYQGFRVMDFKKYANGEFSRILPQVAGS